MSLRALAPAALAIFLLPVSSLPLLSGCAYDPLPVSESKVVTRRVGGTPSDKSAADAATIPEQHIVQQGDTLFSIAWRHGLDYREVARINGISEPWVIRVGQQIRLRGKQSVPQQQVAKPATTPPRPASTARTPTAPAASAPQAVSPAAGSPVVVAPTGDGNWQWPSDGRVLTSFSATGSGPKGISIGGNAGDPVRAAREGQVVYTGSSLVGYGELVIVKHDDVFLSAYAHNSRLLVREGDKVKAGQAIAGMGSTGADRVKLHFEIRRNGQPVDPVGVLPARR